MGPKLAGTPLTTRGNAMLEGYFLPIVELYGVLRIRSGLSQVPVDATTVRDALQCVESAAPALAGRLLVNGRLSPAYRMSLNGTRFVDDLNLSLAQTDSLLLIAADPGG